jgi:hypothetical protein
LRQVNFPFFWRGARSGALAHDRLGRLRKVLDQARVKYAGNEPESALCRLPRRMPPAGQARVDAQKFCFPLAEPGRLALIEGSFRGERNIRQFSMEDMDLLCLYEPEALVLPLDAALSLADQKLRGLLELPSLTVAMVVLTSLADSPLAGHHRDLLWHAFGVPVFEQLRGWDGAVIAKECEVHDGLHIDELAAILQFQEDELLVTQLTAFENPIVRVRTGLTGEIATGYCGCGQETPRLVRLAPLRMKTAAAASGR